MACIAYCNYLFGKVVNVKFRTVALIPGTDEYRKDWLQESPVTPAPPYGIDSISPTRPNPQLIDRLIFTEGEKDRLTLLSCGFPYVLSVANGAETNLTVSHEALEDWIGEAAQIVVCGDSYADCSTSTGRRRSLRNCHRDARTSAKCMPRWVPAR